MRHTALALLALTCLLSAPSPIFAAQCPSGQDMCWQQSQAGDPQFYASSPGQRSEKHIFGNTKINIVADRKGGIELLTGRRGLAYYGHLNQGGYSWVQFLQPSSTTTHNFFSGHFLPQKASFDQLFQSNAITTKTTDSQLQVSHHIAPMRSATASRLDDPAALVDTVTLTNLSQKPMHFKHYEIWDASYFPLTSPITSFRPTAAPWNVFTTLLDLQRLDFAQQFIIHRQIDEHGITISRTYPSDDIPTPDTASRQNYYVAPVYLHSSASGTHFLDATAEKSSLPWTLKILFTGSKQPILMAQTDVSLAPGESQTLTFAYGLQSNATTHITASPRIRPLTPSSATTKLDDLQTLCPLQGTKCADLQREYTWKVKQLSSWALQRDYFSSIAIPQGTIYTYTMGTDAAPRDMEQIIPILSHTDPLLAQQMLRLIMQQQQTNPPSPQGFGNFSYGFFGNGCTASATPYCKSPQQQSYGTRSDLDIYFLWSLEKYYQSSNPQDFSHWLTTANIPFYPNSYAATPLDHIKTAINHLVQDVGLGQHGLIKLKDGDWDDTISLIQTYEGHKIDRNQTIAAGESVTVTQMALHILPKVKRMLHHLQLAPKTQKQIKRFVKPLPAALHACLQTDGQTVWFPRAYVIDTDGQSLAVGDHFIDLGAQVWALQSKDFIQNKVITKAQAIAILEQIHQRLDASSAIGATFWADNAPTTIDPNLLYAITNHGSWSSFRQLLTLAYAQFPETRPYAWQELWKTSFANHLRLYPHTWMGVLSGPDGWDKNTGTTWNFKAIDQNEFPYANTNPNAMWSWALLNIMKVS